MSKLVRSMFVSLDGCIEKTSCFVGPAWSDDAPTHWLRHAFGRARHPLCGRTNFLAADTDATGPAASISCADTVCRLKREAADDIPASDGTRRDDERRRHGARARI